MTGRLSVVFFLSGAAALVFETLWFRQAGLALGNSVWASSLVLASFMGGLALGNALASGSGGRLRRPLAFYAGLEAMIAVTGAGLVFAWPSLGEALAPLFRTLQGTPGALNTARLAIALVLMLAPAAAMGATLPLLAGALGPREASFGRLIGRLYGWNTLGAVSGAVVGEALLVRWLGIRGTALAAATLNLVAAAMALSLSRRIEGVVGAAGRAAAPVAWRLLGAAFLCGATLLALEVVWFRFLSMFVVGTSLTFSLMLAVVLLGIGAGGLLASALLRADPEGARFLRPLLLVAGALTIVTYAAFRIAGGLESTASAPTRIAGLGLRLMFPVSLLSGVAFALLGQRIHAGAGSEARSAGQLTLANTLGALCGSLAGGFVLLPRLGMERSIFLLSVAYGVAAWCVPGAGTPVSRLVGRAALGLQALALVLFPFGLMEGSYFATLGRRFGADGSRMVAVREGLTETVLYLRRDSPTRPSVFRMVTNGFSMSGTLLPSRRYMSLYAWWPAALHPGPRRALLISYGVGITARALLGIPGLERVDVVDISRDVLEMSGIVHPGAENPLLDRRAVVHVEDGRQFLQTTDRRFDLITGEPPPPRNAGVVSLYTREYFRLMNGRLAPGGVVTYWLPVDQLLVSDTRAIIGAFCGAFPDCSLWSGGALNWMLVGTNRLVGPVPEERFSRPWRDPELRRELLGLGLEVPEQLGALFIGDAAYLRELAADEAPLVDDFPYRIAAPAAGLDFARSVQPVYRRWMDASGARERFARSAFVAALWPPAMRERTLGYFEWQGQIDAGMITGAAWRPPAAAGLAELDGVLARSPLRTLALWWLGTSAEEQDVVAGLASQGQRIEELIGMGRLAARDFDAAADAFARAPGLANAYRRAYALALGGRRAEAEALAREVRSSAGPPADEATWAWMGERFGLSLREAGPSR